MGPNCLRQAKEVTATMEVFNPGMDLPPEKDRDEETVVKRE